MRSAAAGVPGATCERSCGVMNGICLSLSGADRLVLVCEMCGFSGVLNVLHMLRGAVRSKRPRGGQACQCIVTYNL